MEIQPSRSIIPWGNLFVRWGLRGGALAALAPLTIGLMANVSGGAMLAVLGFGAVVGGALPTIGALMFSRRRISLSFVQGELGRAREMLERRLISEDEYLQLKSQILTYYQPGRAQMPDLRPVIYWGAVLGMLGCATVVMSTTHSLFAILTAAGVVGVSGGLVSGGAALTYAFASVMAPRFHLPAPETRKLLDE